MSMLNVSPTNGRPTVPGGRGRLLAASLVLSTYHLQSEEATRKRMTGTRYGSTYCIDDVAMSRSYKQYSYSESS